MVSPRPNGPGKRFPNIPLLKPDGRLRLVQGISDSVTGGTSYKGHPLREQSFICWRWVSFFKEVDYTLYLDKLSEASVDCQVGAHSDEDYVQHATKYSQNLHWMASRWLSKISSKDKLTRTDTILVNQC